MKTLTNKILKFLELKRSFRHYSKRKEYLLVTIKFYQNKKKSI